MADQANARVFIQKLIADEPLRVSLRNCRSLAEIKDKLANAGLGDFDKEDLSAEIQVANDTLVGVRFVLDKLSSGSELTDEDLENVAGGKRLDGKPDDPDRRNPMYFH